MTSFPKAKLPGAMPGFGRGVFDQSSPDRATSPLLSDNLAASLFDPVRKLSLADSPVAQYAQSLYPSSATSSQASSANGPWRAGLDSLSSLRPADFGNAQTAAAAQSEGTPYPFNSVDMAAANALAIATAGQSSDISPLSSEFSKLNSLPDFGAGSGWRSAYSPHARQGAFEHDLPGQSGMVVKAYLGDTDNRGENTITITSPTWSLTHFLEQAEYRMGHNINETHARKFLKGLR